jgi:hypothetical protein
VTASAALRVAAAAVLLTAAPLHAQAEFGLDVRDGAPVVTVQDVLGDAALEDAVRSGLPLRMRFRLELWRDEIFDDLVQEATWSAVVAFEPLEATFLAGASGDSLTAYGSWEAARPALERAYTPALRPRRSGRYYYLATLEVETLSLSDLDELERWLRGDLEPAVRGRRSVGGAVGTGLKRILIRVLGLPARRYEDRSDPFRVP